MCEATVPPRDAPHRIWSSPFPPLSALWSSPLPHPSGRPESNLCVVHKPDRRPKSECLPTNLPLQSLPQAEAPGQESTLT